MEAPTRTRIWETSDLWLPEDRQAHRILLFVVLTSTASYLQDTVTSQEVHLGPTEILIDHQVLRIPQLDFLFIAWCRFSTVVAFLAVGVCTVASHKSSKMQSADFPYSVALDSDGLVCAFIKTQDAKAVYMASHIRALIEHSI